MASPEEQDYSPGLTPVCCSYRRMGFLNMFVKKAEDGSTHHISGIVVTLIVPFILVVYLISLLSDLQREPYDLTQKTGVTVSSRDVEIVCEAPNGACLVSSVYTLTRGPAEDCAGLTDTNQCTRVAYKARATFKLCASASAQDGLFIYWNTKRSKRGRRLSSGRRLQPTNDFGGTTNDFGGTTNDFGGTTDDFGGTTNDFGGTTNDFGGTTDDFGGTTNDFGGTTDDFGGTTNDFGGPTDDYSPGWDDFLADDPYSFDDPFYGGGGGGYPGGGYYYDDDGFWSTDDGGAFWGSDDAWASPDDDGGRSYWSSWTDDEPPPFEDTAAAAEAAARGIASTSSYFDPNKGSSRIWVGVSVLSTIVSLQKDGARTTVSRDVGGVPIVRGRHVIQSLGGTFTDFQGFANTESVVTESQGWLPLAADLSSSLSNLRFANQLNSSQLSSCIWRVVQLANASVYADADLLARIATDGLLKTAKGLDPKGLPVPAVIVSYLNDVDGDLASAQIQMSGTRFESHITRRSWSFIAGALGGILSISLAAGGGIVSLLSMLDTKVLSVMCCIKDSAHESTAPASTDFKSENAMHNKPGVA